jgi:hypothetical protein
MNEELNKLTANDFWLVIFAAAVISFMLGFGG